MNQKFPIKEYKEKLGEKTGAYTFPNGKETFGVNIYEDGFVLKKRGQVIVLDLFNLLILKDLINNYNKKKQVLEAL